MTYASGSRSDFSRLAQRRVRVNVCHAHRLHLAQLLIVDGHQALVNSQNLSTRSLQHDRSCRISVEAVDAVAVIGRTFQAS